MARTNTQNNFIDRLRQDGVDFSDLSQLLMKFSPYPQQQIVGKLAQLSEFKPDPNLYKLRLVKVLQEVADLQGLKEKFGFPGSLDALAEEIAVQHLIASGLSGDGGDGGSEFLSASDTPGPRPDSGRKSSTLTAV